VSARARAWEAFNQARTAPTERAPHGLRLFPGAWAEDIAHCPGCGNRMLRIGLCQTHGLCGWCHEDDGITPHPRRDRG